MDEQVATSVNGVPIRLTDERWQHIAERHPQLVGRAASLRDAVAFPDRVHEGEEGTLLAVRRDGDVYLVVVYQEISPSDGFVITAYQARRMKRRNVVWER